MKTKSGAPGFTRSGVSVFIPRVCVSLASMVYRLALAEPTELTISLWPPMVSNETVMAHKGNGNLVQHHNAKAFAEALTLIALNKPTRFIAKVTGISRATVIGIKKRRTSEIETRKKELAPELMDVAMIGTQRMKETVADLNGYQAALVTGIAVDKVVSITQPNQGQVQVAVILPSDTERMSRDQMHEKLDAIWRKLDAGGGGSVLDAE